MAFNLDKNDGAKSSTKFDLSKSNTPASTDTTEGKHRSKTRLFVLPLLLIAGIAAWYFLSKSGPGNKDGITAITTTDTTNADPSVEQNKISTSVGDSLADVKKENTAGSTTAAAGNNNADATPAATTNTSAVTNSGFNNKVPATFSKGSTSIGNLDRSLLKEIINFLEKNSAAVITVNGYASSEGELAFNQQISQSRANAFKNYLLSKGIDAGRIKAYGKGIDNPVGSNDTENGRIKNRRVEIVFQ
ncbi:MAG TPA: OmpA family protein [Chitinophagaceae bacterium]